MVIAAAASGARELAMMHASIAASIDMERRIDAHIARTRRVRQPTVKSDRLGLLRQTVAIRPVRNFARQSNQTHLGRQ
jgi:hypothetical protein